jgi:EmrB/QacA subfamily drug resistance transporter
VADLRQNYGERWRWYAVGTLMVATMATVLSSTSINVALADIMNAFDLGQGQVHWLATGYLAAMTLAMLCSTWVVDHVGVRNGTILAMLAFSLISVAGGLSSDIYSLFASRFALGALSGLMQPMAMYLIFRIFPENQRGRVLGYYGFGVVLAPALGPVIGGVLTDALSWRYVFYAPVPVTTLAALLAWRFLPVKTQRPPRYPFDAVGLMLLTVVILCSLEALNSLQHAETGAVLRMTVSFAAIISLLVFIWFERRVSNPLLNVQLLMRKPFLKSCAGAIALGLGMYGTTYLIPVYSQSALGFSPTMAGMVMLPAGALLGMTLFFGGRLCDQFGAKYLLFVGTGFLGISAFIFSQSGITAGFWFVALGALISRIGMGLLLPAVSISALDRLDVSELSDGSSTISFVRQLGGAYGINIIALLIETGDGMPRLPGLPLGEFSVAWLFMGGVLALLLWPISRMAARARLQPGS